MSSELLPEPLPENPLPIFAAWFEQARTQRVQPNSDAMVLATVGANGAPSARVVLCRRMALDLGYVAFFTNYESRKGRELVHNSRAAAVIHWDTLHRQVRLEGRVVRSPARESDDYFASRPVQSRISAWASRQSEPLASRATLAHQVHEATSRFGVTPDAADAAVPRPPHWGGYRLWIEVIELWAEGSNRVHERAVWRRELIPIDEYTFKATAWSGTRLNP
jgi:pyridoxamine 5'-phosphate oxidase